MWRAIKSAQHLRRGPLCRAARLFILDEINLFVLGANRLGRAHNDRCRGLLHLARSVKRVQRHLLDYLQIDYGLLSVLHLCQLASFDLNLSLFVDVFEQLEV